MRHCCTDCRHGPIFHVDRYPEKECAGLIQGRIEKERRQIWPTTVWPCPRWRAPIPDPSPETQRIA